jgi:hypothetical protein
VVFHLAGAGLGASAAICLLRWCASTKQLLRRGVASTRRIPCDIFGANHGAPFAAMEARVDDDKLKVGSSNKEVGAEEA